MNRSLRERARQLFIRGAFLLVAGAAIFCSALYARHLLTEENAQATTLVADGQRAMTHDDRATAALDFERARWLAPRAKIVRDALASTGIKDPEPFLLRTLRFVSGQEWTAMAVASGWLSGIALLFFVARNDRKNTLRFALATSLVFVAVAAAVEIESSAATPAIVTADEHFRVAPYASAEAQAAAPAGTMVILGTPYEDFVQVLGGDGTKGWVRRKDVELIASPES